MNWNDYKERVKAEDPDSGSLIEEAEVEAAIISAMIKQRSLLGISQRELAALCDMPQSSVARIESYKTVPRLDTILKLLSQLGLKLDVVPITK